MIELLPEEMENIAGSFAELVRLTTAAQADCGAGRSKQAAVQLSRAIVLAAAAKSYVDRLGNELGAEPEQKPKPLRTRLGYAKIYQIGELTPGKRWYSLEEVQKLGGPCPGTLQLWHHQGRIQLDYAPDPKQGNRLGVSDVELVYLKRLGITPEKPGPLHPSRAAARRYMAEA